MKVPFLFHGCAQVHKTVHKTNNVTRIGYCQSLCGHHRPFGLKALTGVDISNPTSVMECLCFNTSVPEIKLGHWDNNQHSLCKMDWFAIFSQIWVNDSPGINSGSGSTGDCLTYRYSGFQWKSCVSENNLTVICSYKPKADPSARAYVSTKQSSTWIEGNSICLKKNMYPANISSMVLSGLNADQQQYHWTGIVRAATLINKAGMLSLGTTRYSVADYAFLHGSEKMLKFANSAAKQALCLVNRASFIPNQTRFTERESTTTKFKEESPALGAGIGVLVVVLVVVGIGLAVVMLRRRGIIPARLKNRAPNRKGDTHDGMLPNAASNVARVHKSVVNPNYFVLEKQTESVIEQIDRYNKSEDLETDIIDENIYHSIDEPAAELRGNVKGDCSDYDCTTDGAATSRGITHDNAYNKLKLDRQGNYDHVKRSCQINNITAHNDYDTTATLKAIRPRGHDDYDHVGGMGHAPALSSSGDDNCSAVKFATHARASVAELDKRDDSHGKNPFVTV